MEQRGMKEMKRLSAYTFEGRQVPKARENEARRRYCKAFTHKRKDAWCTKDERSVATEVYSALQ